MCLTFKLQYNIFQLRFSCFGPKQRYLIFFYPTKTWSFVESWLVKTHQIQLPLISCQSLKSQIYLLFCWRQSVSHCTVCLRTRKLITSNNHYFWSWHCCLDSEEVLLDWQTEWNQCTSCLWGRVDVDHSQEHKHNDIHHGHTFVTAILLGVLLSQNDRTGNHTSHSNHLLRQDGFKTNIDISSLLNECNPILSIRLWKCRTVLRIIGRSQYELNGRNGFWVYSNQHEIVFLTECQLHVGSSFTGFSQLLDSTGQKVSFKKHVSVNSRTSGKRSISRLEKISTVVLWSFVLSLRDDVQSDHLFLHCWGTHQSIFAIQSVWKFHQSVVPCPVDDDFHELQHLLLRSVFLAVRVPKVQNDTERKRKSTDISDRKDGTWRKQSWSCELPSCLCSGLLGLLLTALFDDDFISIDWWVHLQFVTDIRFEYFLLCPDMRLETLSQVNQSAQSFSESLLRYFCGVFGHLLLVCQSQSVIWQFVRDFDVHNHGVGCSDFGDWSCENLDWKGLQEKTLKW